MSLKTKFRGFTIISLFVALILIILISILIVYYLINKPAISIIIQNTSGYINENTCKINPPFSCYAWKFDENTNQLTLEILNQNNIDYIIKTISVSGCVTSSPINIINKNSMKTFTLICSIEEYKANPQLQRIISINYKTI